MAKKEATAEEIAAEAAAAAEAKAAADAEAAAAAKGVTVRLSCVLSGHPDNPGPGSIVTLDADEAARLIELGVAEVATPDAAPDGDGEFA